MVAAVRKFLTRHTKFIVARWASTWPRLRSHVAGLVALDLALRRPTATVAFVLWMAMVASVNSGREDDFAAPKLGYLSVEHALHK